jgi:hypothetical protein
LGLGVGFGFGRGRCFFFVVGEFGFLVVGFKE